MFNAIFIILDFTINTRPTVAKKDIFQSVYIQATLVTSTMHSSTLPLTSTQTPSPNIFPYMFIAFQQRIIRTTVSSSKRVIRHQFQVPIMNFRITRIIFHRKCMGGKVNRGIRYKFFVYFFSSCFSQFFVPENSKQQ